MKNQTLLMAVFGCLTLGLAPYTPHAHIWKQLKNLWYGRTMTGMDWFDLAMHGAPWIFLIYVLTKMTRDYFRAKRSAQ